MKVFEESIQAMCNIWKPWTHGSFYVYTRDIMPSEISEIRKDTVWSHLYVECKNVELCPCVLYSSFCNPLFPLSPPPRGGGMGRKGIQLYSNNNKNFKKKKKNVELIVAESRKVVVRGWEMWKGRLVLRVQSFI